MASKTNVRSWRAKLDVGEYLSENRLAYLLLAPSFLSILLLLWFPFFEGVRLSMFTWPLGGEQTFVGLENYADLLNRDSFRTAMRATAIYMSSTFFQLVLGLAAALSLNQMNRFQNITGAAFLIAYTLPPVVTGGIWKYLMNPRFGPVFQYLQQWGVLQEPIFWSSNGDVALAIVTWAMTWMIWPFMFLVLYASRQGIPDSYYEAAEIYGAGHWARFRRITLPQLRSAILVVLALRVIWNLSRVSQPLTLTGGGPGYETSIIGVYLYNLLVEGNLGTASASGVILFALSLIGVALFLYSYDKEVQF